MAKKLDKWNEAVGGLTGKKAKNQQVEPEEPVEEPSDDVDLEDALDDITDVDTDLGDELDFAGQPEEFDLDAEEDDKKSTKKAKKTKDSKKPDVSDISLDDLRRQIEARFRQESKKKAFEPPETPVEIPDVDPEKLLAEGDITGAIRVLTQQTVAKELSDYQSKQAAQQATSTLEADFHQARKEIYDAYPLLHQLDQITDQEQYKEFAKRVPIAAELQRAYSEFPDSVRSGDGLRQIRALAEARLAARQASGTETEAERAASATAASASSTGNRSRVEAPGNKIQLSPTQTRIAQRLGVGSEGYAEALSRPVNPSTNGRHVMDKKWYNKYAGGAKRGGGGPRQVG